MNTPQETHSGDVIILLDSCAGAVGHPVICAWCEEVLEEGPGPVSHGMCPACHAAFMAMIPEE